MNELKQFNFENNQVRTLLINDEPWFVGKDVAEILGYSNPRDALSKHVDSEDKNSVAIHDGNKGNPNLTIINESGVYALVFSSKLQSAKKFKHWVTSEVLPTLRKTGSYATPQLTGEELMAKVLIEAKSVLERQNKQIIEMKPKALFADTVAASDSSILVGQEAKLISQSGCKMGQNRFFAWLRENGYLCSKGENYNMPTQKSR
jgi:anti-repressor protein